MSAPLEPPASDEAAPFWDATTARRSCSRGAAACDRPFFYPRATCPGCLGADIEWRGCDRHGVVYAASVKHLPAPAATRPTGPYSSCSSTSTKGSG